MINSIVPITLIRGSGVDLSITKKKTKISMACRLLKDKGVFDAVKILKQKLPNVEFELYGDIDIHNPASLINEDVEKMVL